MQKPKIWRTIQIEEELWVSALEKSKNDQVPLSALIRIFLKRWLEGKIVFDIREK